jgi:hypothetical protein
LGLIIKTYKNFRSKKWESNGFIKVVILDPIKEPLRKVMERKNEAYTTLLEFLEGYFCCMDNSIP